MGLMIYAACNGIPTFASTQLLFGNHRPYWTYAFQRIRILDPLNRLFVPLAGFSPYTAHYIITNSPYLYEPFHGSTRLGWLFALQPSFPTLYRHTRLTAPQAVCVCPFVALPTHLSNTISVVSAALIWAPLTPQPIKPRNVSPHETHQ